MIYLFARFVIKEDIKNFSFLSKIKFRILKSPWYIFLRSIIPNKENIVYLNAAYVQIPTNDMLAILGDLAREFGPAVAASIFLFIRSVDHLNEYFERIHYNYSSISGLQTYMDNVGSGKVTNMLFPRIERNINAMHERVNSELYDAFVNAAEAFSNPEFLAAINNMNGNHLTRFYRILAPVMDSVHTAFENVLSIFPHLVSHGVTVGTGRTLAISTTFTLLYYIGRAM